LPGSQTVKAPFVETRGHDGGKRIVWRKRHVATDTDGRLLMVNLTPAGVLDTATAEALQAIADFDLNTLASTEPPRGYGRD
jgi:hypothetical protein